MTIMESVLGATGAGTTTMRIVANTATMVVIGLEAAMMTMESVLAASCVGATMMCIVANSAMAAIGVGALRLLNRLLQQRKRAQHQHRRPSALMELRWRVESILELQGLEFGCVIMPCVKEFRLESMFLEFDVGVFTVHGGVFVHMRPRSILPK